MKNLIFAACVLFAVSLSAQTTQPVVAIHVSEQTEALATTPASAPTPTGAGTTGYQWWTPYWQPFVMSEALKEALRSDGTPFVVVTDADIAAGQLLTASGAPAYPIVISLANEAISSNEVTPLLNYVSAGGYLFMGGSSFTRNPDGTTLGDFALASQMGLHMAVSNLQNWYANTTFTNSSSGNQLTSTYSNRDCHLADAINLRGYFVGHIATSELAVADPTLPLHLAGYEQPCHGDCDR